jgi:hypothetical protein
MATERWIKFRRTPSREPIAAAIEAIAVKEGKDAAEIWTEAARQLIDRRAKADGMHAVITINGVDIPLRELLRVPVRIEPTTKTRRKRL